MSFKSRNPENKSKNSIHIVNKKSDVKKIGKFREILHEGDLKKDVEQGYCGHDNPGVWED